MRKGHWLRLKCKHKSKKTDMIKILKHNYSILILSPLHSGWGLILLRYCFGFSNTNIHSYWVWILYPLDLFCNTPPSFKLPPLLHPHVNSYIYIDVYANVHVYLIILHTLTSIYWHTHYLLNM